MGAALGTQRNTYGPSAVSSMTGVNPASFRMASMNPKARMQEEFFAMPADQLKAELAQVEGLAEDIRTVLKARKELPLVNTARGSSMRVQPAPLSPYASQYSQYPNNTYSTFDGRPDFGSPGIANEWGGRKRSVPKKLKGGRSSPACPSHKRRCDKKSKRK